MSYPDFTVCLCNSFGIGLHNYNMFWNLFPTVYYVVWGHYLAFGIQFWVTGIFEFLMPRFLIGRGNFIYLGVHLTNIEQCIIKVSVSCGDRLLNLSGLTIQGLILADVTAPYAVCLFCSFPWCRFPAVSRMWVPSIFLSGLIQKPLCPTLY